MKKTIAIVIATVIAIASITANCFLIAKVKTVPEKLVLDGKIVECEKEEENAYRLEIDTEDGNTWSAFSSDRLEKGQKVVVYFYTFESENLGEWEIVNYYLV